MMQHARVAQLLITVTRVGLQSVIVAFLVIILPFLSDIILESDTCINILYSSLHALL